MQYNFESLINTLGDSQNVENKLMIFSLYYDLYQDLMNQYDSIKKFYTYQEFNEYQSFLENTLCEIVGIEYLDDDFDYVELFYHKIRKHDISRFWIMKSVIDDQTRSFRHKINSMKYVSVLNSMNFDFNTSAYILVVFKEHIRNMYYTMVDETYKCNTISKLCNAVVMELSFLLPDILKKIDSFDMFSLSLKKETKKIIMDKIDRKEFDLFDFYNEFKFCYINLLDNMELDICRLRLVYVLSGYKLDSMEFKTNIYDEVYDKFQLSEDDYYKVVTSIRGKFKNFEKSINEGKKLKLTIN